MRSLLSIELLRALTGPMHDSQKDFQDHTWVALEDLVDASSFDRYITAVYWSMSTLCTVGYGDVTPGM